jgi:two-component system NtrC family sensor kinase
MTPTKTKAKVTPGARQLLEKLIRVLQELFNYPHAAILLVEENGQELYLVASSGYRREVERNFKILIGSEGITGWVARQKKPLYVPDVRKDPRYIRGVARGRSEMAVPLLSGKKLIGVLDVESEQPDAFSRRDLKILSLFATQAALAIQNTQLYEQERKKSLQLRLLNDVGRKMASSLDPEKILPILVKAVRRDFNYHHVMVLLREGEDDVVLNAQVGDSGFLFPEDYRQKLGEGIIGTVAQTGKTILCNDVSQDPRYFRALEATRSELAVPIILGRQVLGVINVESHERNAFDPIDQDILETLSRQLAGVIQNARIYQDCKRTKDFLQKLIESSVDAITTADNLGNLRFWSKGAEEIFGYRADEVLGKSATQFYARGREEARRFMWQLLKKGRLRNVEFEYLGKNGSKIYGSLSASLLRDEHGAITGSLGIIRDITELKVLSQQLLESERFATIGKLSTQVAHEIMNPLSSIKMNIRILAKREGLSANDQRRLAIANFEIDHLEKILQDIFDYSKAFRLNLSKENLHDVIEKSLMMIQDHLDEKRIIVQKRLGAKLESISIDLVRMMQVFTNLFLNASEAMAEGGKLKIATAETKIGNTRHLEITVSDNGPGIAAIHRAAIFDPFYTTKSGGTGLGLAIVKKIIELHHGQIEVSSKVDQYTSFKIMLPYK